MPHSGSDSTRRGRHGVQTWFSRVFLAKPEEAGAMLWSAAYHFFVLFSYFLVRPFRESVGIERRYEDLAWLMTGTMTVMLLANPVFALLVSRTPRRRFIPLTYRFFALTLLAFYLAFSLIGPAPRLQLGYAFYIWLSVFNLFIVSIFWAFMADIFTREQGKRLFGFIAVGGTLGALAGPLVTTQLVSGVQGQGQTVLQLQPHSMLLLSCVFLEVAVQCVKRLLARIQTISDVAVHAHAEDQPLRKGAEPGPGALEGLRLVVKSPLLMLIAAFILIFTVLSSLLYMEQGRIVALTFADSASRTAAFARLDVYTQSLTLVLQALLTGRIMKRLGVGSTLMILPLLTICGFAALMLRDTFAVLATFMVLRRAFHHALDRPAREVLYTVVSADAKYKSKSFIDTFIYRGGDVIGGWAARLMSHLGAAVGWLAIPLATISLLIAAALGAVQRRVPTTTTRRR